MAINKKLIHFKTKAAFEAQLAGSNILGTSIVFIQDANLIWTHGTYYGKSEIHIGTNEPTNGEIIWINSDTDEMKYFDGTQWVTVSGRAIPEETLIINLVSNQTSPDSNLNGVIVNVRYADVDHKQTWAGEALSFKILNGTEYTIEYSDITDSEGNKIYATPTAETYTAVGNETRTLSRYYNSEKLTVNVSGVSSGFTITVNGQSQTATSGTYYIPYGTAYTISASSVKGYITKISESSITANKQTRTVTVTYGTITNGVYICDNTGALTDVGSWNTSNNSSAIGVAVISDNCAFVIEKTVSYSLKKWGGYGTAISGIVTIANSNTAKTDYVGESNTTEIINQLGSGNAPAANYCRGRSCKVNGTKLHGYLGALGEWQTAYNNKSSIDSALSKIGGTALKTNYHWTSTQYSPDYAWILKWSNGSVGNGSKSGGNFVRAFYSLPQQK